MIDISQVFPCFQPIVAVSDGMIYAYEVLGRYEDNGALKSLGGFFYDPDIKSETKLLYDRAVRRAALSYFRMKDIDSRLFININPSWILAHLGDKGSLPSLLYMQGIGVKMDRIVIEITEEEFTQDISLLREFIDIYHSYGCKVAIDDFNFDNFDRLLHLTPDYVKIDMALMKKSMESRQLFRMIRHISEFSREEGVSVIFEGVETSEELRHAIFAGGCMIQGFFFSQAESDFQDKTKFSAMMRENLAEANRISFDKASRHMESEAAYNIQFEWAMKEYPYERNGGLDEYIFVILPRIPEECIRIYVCGENGNQLSSNFDRLPSGGFSQTHEFNGKT